MPTYAVESPDGRKFSVEGDTPPSESDLDEIFSRGQKPDAGAALKLNPDDYISPETRKSLSEIQPGEVQGKFEGSPDFFSAPETMPDRVLRQLGETKAAKFVQKPLVDMGQAARDYMAKATAEDPNRKRAAITTGVAGGAGDLLSFFTSPLGIATLGTGALPKVAQSAISTAFVAQMASQLPDTANELMAELRQPEDQRDYEKIARLSTSGTAGALLTGLGAKHGMREGPVESPTTQKGAENAVPVRSTAEVPVEEPSGRSPTVGEGVSQPAQPADAQASKWTSATAPEAGVPEEVKPVEASPVVEGGGNTETIPAVSEINPELKTPTEGRQHSTDLPEAKGKNEQNERVRLGSGTGGEAGAETAGEKGSSGVQAAKVAEPSDRGVGPSGGSDSASVPSDTTAAVQGEAAKPTATIPKSAGHLAFVEIPDFSSPNSPPKTTEFYIKGKTLYRTDSGYPIGKSGVRRSGFSTQIKSKEEALKIIEDYRTWMTQQALASQKQMAGFAADAEARDKKQRDDWAAKQAAASGQTPAAAAAKVESIGAGIKSALESNKGTEAAFINLDPLRDFLDRSGVTPAVRASIEAVREVGKEAFSGKKMTDYRRSVLNWSMKLQRSFQEAHDAQAEIQSKIKDPIRREGITNWIQADGDAAVLRSRAAASNPKLRPGYEAALTLTPDEISVARDVKAAYDALGRRGILYNVLNSFKQNYVTQIWDLGRKAPSGGATSRTLRDKFRFSKASTFPTFFDGEQAGFTPKTKDISKLLPVYIHEMNTVIAARQLVEQMAGGVASDGRPLLAPKGVGVPVDDAAGNREATLVMPNAKKGDTGDYKSMSGQPALSDWRWVAKDADGKPIFLKGDLTVHPEAADRFKNVLGKSAISEWYNSKTSAGAAIPKAMARWIDRGQGEVKRTMLGLFAPFHQVQEGTHAIGHRVDPVFNVPKIDLIGDAAQADAAKHGLMLLPDRASEGQFMDGFRHSGLVSRIPGIGPAADWYSHYLFHRYIPGLKYKTYQAILDRNMKVFADDLTAGKVNPEDVKVLSAEQANAAYGHLNYADLGRNPTIQHIMRLGLLAPDFLEARAKFAGQAIKGLTGAKVGREQLLALATLGIAQAVTAYTAAKLTGGEWDAKHPFEFVKGNRRYTMRSVPEDAFRLVTDTRAFIYARLNPIIGRGGIQYLSGVDWRGQKKTALETTKELAQQPVPLTLRGFFSIGNTPLNQWEQLASAVGLKISRYSAQHDVYKLVDEFKKNSKDPKLVAEFERRQKETMADSDYKPLREALEKGDTDAAKKAYTELLKTKKSNIINRAMQPNIVSKIPGTDYWQTSPKPFTGSKLAEQKFLKSFSAEDKSTYNKARAEREAQYEKFKAMLKAKPPASATPR